MEAGSRAECFKLVSDTGEVIRKIHNDELQLIPAFEPSDELAIPDYPEYQFFVKCKTDKRLWDFLFILAGGLVVKR